MTIPSLLTLIQFTFVAIFPLLFVIFLAICVTLFLAYFIKSFKQCNSISVMVGC